MTGHSWWDIDFSCSFIYYFCKSIYHLWTRWFICRPCNSYSCTCWCCSWKTRNWWSSIYYVYRSRYLHSWVSTWIGNIISNSIASKRSNVHTSSAYYISSNITIFNITSNRSIISIRQSYFLSNNSTSCERNRWWISQYYINRSCNSRCDIPWSIYYIIADSLSSDYRCIYASCTDWSTTRIIVISARSSYICITTIFNELNNSRSCESYYWSSCIYDIHSSRNLNSRITWAIIYIITYYVWTSCRSIYWIYCHYICRNISILSIWGSSPSICICCIYFYYFW